MPPFWFHRVIAEGTAIIVINLLDLSISVSTWGDSEEIQLYYDHIQETPLPFEENWTKEQYSVALRVFINVLLSELDRSASFVTSIVDQRYASIFGRHKDEKHTCWSDAQFTSPFQSNFKNRAQDIAAKFKKMPKFTNDEAIVDIILSNYVELIVDFLMGTEHVNSFLQSCF